ncbi:hypothetical protein H2203_002220 [Taxawa tesnikishii (nom. ined.)]|nr:hypothetical protein H2203_002220 [Dothideales sp. JES 119]
MPSRKLYQLPPTPPLTPINQDITLDMRPKDAYWLTLFMLLTFFFDLDTSRMDPGLRIFVMACKGFVLPYYFLYLRYCIQQRAQEIKKDWKTGVGPGRVFRLVEAEQTGIGTGRVFHLVEKERKMWWRR